MTSHKELAIAAASGDLQSAVRMLDAEPELAKHWQPIMDACFHGQVAVVKFLLERGADPNVISKSTYRYRPLHRTVEHKVTVPRGPQHREVVELLLAAGGDPMARGSGWGITAVALAALSGEPQFLPLLLRDRSPSDIFTAAVLADADRVGALLAQDPTLATRPDENSWPAIHYCAGSRVGQGDPAAAARLPIVAKLLLDHGADPSPGLGPALGANNVEVAKLLLERGAVLDDGDALVHTAEAGNFEVLDLLARNGADLQSTKGTEHHGGYTPLGSLMTIRSARGARWFLQKGIDPNWVAGDREETALHVAVRYGCAPETLQILVDHGVNVQARDREGQTALDVAREGRKEKAVAFLESLGADAQEVSL